MSEWYYHKPSLLGGKSLGPFSDAEMLAFAFDGTITPDTEVCEITHTNDQWVPCKNVPAFLAKYKEGEEPRAKTREAERKAKEERALIVAKDKQAQREAQAAARSAKRSAVPAAGVNDALQGQVVSSWAAPGQQAQPIVIHAGTYADPRLNSAGWFARAFSTTAGVLLAIMTILGAIVALTCGGCVFLSAYHYASESAREAEKTMERRAQPVTQQRDAVGRDGISD